MFFATWKKVATGCVVAVSLAACQNTGSNAPLETQTASVGEYQRGLRIALARKALAEPHRSIADVAAMTGFNDQSHFARVFRRITGETPRDYRHRLQRAC